MYTIQEHWILNLRNNDNLDQIFRQFWLCGPVSDQTQPRQLFPDFTHEMCNPSINASLVGII